MVVFQLDLNSFDELMNGNELNSASSLGIHGRRTDNNNQILPQLINDAFPSSSVTLKIQGYGVEPRGVWLALVA